MRILIVVVLLQSETDEFLAEMDEDVEGMQSTIYLLQQQLKDAKDQIAQLQSENNQLRALSATDATAAAAQDAMDTDDDDTRTRQPSRTIEERNWSNARQDDSNDVVSHRKELRQTHSSIDDDDVTSPEQCGVANGYSAENDTDDEDGEPLRKSQKQYEGSPREELSSKRRTADTPTRDDDAHAHGVTHQNGATRYDSS